MPGNKPVTKLDRCVASVMKDGKSKDSAYAICQASIGGKSGDAKKSIEHRGVTFPGYNKPRKSTRPGKKKMVLAKQGDKVKVIHYGDTDYKHNYSAEAKKNFRARHRCGEQKDKLSAAYWACRDLWPSGSTKKSARQMKDDPCWSGYEMVGHKMKDGKKVPNCVPKSTKKSGSFLMKKIEVNNNETYTIKGVNGETYVFHGGDLFLDAPEAMIPTATILKSLRTEQGAESWLKLAGRRYENAVIMDTGSLVELLGTLKSAKDEMPEFDATLPFHVVSVEGMDEDKDEEMDALEMEPGMQEEHEELMEDEEQEQDMTETQIAQVLHDAQKLYDMIKDDEHLEPWMQAKLTKVAEYMNALAENLEHEDGDIPEKDDVDGVDVDVDDSGASLPSLPSMPVKPEAPKDEDDLPEMPDLEDVKKSKLQNLLVDYAETFGKEVPEGAEVEDVVRALKTGVEIGGSSSATEEGEGQKSMQAEPALMSMHSQKSLDESVTGMVFKSLHAARQWNRFENPDKDRYYIDIMREKDARKGFSKSTGLNAKYVVRDRYEDDDMVIKGAYGNKKVPKKATAVPPMKKIDPETLHVSAIKE